MRAEPPSDFAPLAPLAHPIYLIGISPLAPLAPLDGGSNQPKRASCPALPHLPPSTCPTRLLACPHGNVNFHVARSSHMQTYVSILRGKQGKWGKRGRWGQRGKCSKWGKRQAGQVVPGQGEWGKGWEGASDGNRPGTKWGKWPRCERYWGVDLSHSVLWKSLCMRVPLRESTSGNKRRPREGPGSHGRRC